MAAKKRRPPKDEGDVAIFRAHMQDALAMAKEGEGELAVLYQDVANDVKAKVKARGDSVTQAQLEKDIDEAFNKVALKRIRIIRARIEKAGQIGPKAANETLKKAFGKELGKAKIPTSKKAAKQAAERIAGRMSVDKTSVQKRLKRVDKEVASEMAAEVQKGIRQKKGILGAAREIEKLDPRDVKLPKYIQRIKDAAKAGDSEKVKALTKRYAKYVDSLGEHQPDDTKKASAYSMRSATKRFMKDIEKAGVEGVDGIVDKYVKERAAYRANTIARHETVEAMRRSYIEQAKDKPGVYGMRWILSPLRHKIEDECDVYATQNAYDLGPGVYPVDKVPTNPHPNCLPPGTLIETSTGFVPVEDVAPGMLVRTHTGALRPVLRTIERAWHGELVVATIGDKRLVATPEHPVLAWQSWVMMDELEVGDSVWVRKDLQLDPTEHDYFVLRDVVALELCPYKGLVYNFAVAVDESYVANGVVTHNCICTVVAAIDRKHFSREEPANDNALPQELKDTKSPDALAWLKQNEAAAAKILGPTRHRMLKEGVNVLDAEGKPLRVKDLLGKKAEPQKVAVGQSHRPPSTPPARPAKPAATKPRPKPAPKPKPVASTSRPKPVAPPAPAPAPKLPPMQPAASSAPVPLPPPPKPAAPPPLPPLPKPVLPPMAPAPANDLVAPPALPKPAPVPPAVPPPPRRPKSAPVFRDGEAEQQYVEARSQAQKDFGPGLPQLATEYPHRDPRRGVARPDSDRSAVDLAMDKAGLKGVAQAWTGVLGSISGWYRNTTPQLAELGKYIFRGLGKKGEALLRKLRQERAYPGPAEDFLRFARTQYAYTQESIERRIAEGMPPPGVDQDGMVVLYRGVTREPAQAARKGMKGVPVRPLSSWSTSRAEAEQFAGGTGVVLEKRVHYTRAFSVYDQSGTAQDMMPGENEWILAYPEARLDVDAVHDMLDKRGEDIL